MNVYKYKLWRTKRRRLKTLRRYAELDAQVSSYLYNIGDVTYIDSLSEVQERIMEQVIARRKQRTLARLASWWKQRAHLPQA